MSARRVSVGCLLAIELSACRAPTQVTVAITTDLPCAEVEGVTITAAPELGADTKTYDIQTVQCAASGEIGTIVLLPRAGDDDFGFAVRVVGGRGVDPRGCLPPAYAPDPSDKAPPGSGCIVARRQLAFVPHEPLLLPVELDAACVGKPCDPTTTCFAGDCVPATVPDPERCAEPGGCPLEPGGTGGAGGGCAPGATQPCYTGPAASEGQGACKPGTTTCAPDGTFGPCEGEILPAAQDCSTSDVDETCTGVSGACTDEWQRFVDTLAADEVDAVTIGTDGSVVAAGFIRGTWSFAGQTWPTVSRQLFAAKWDASGNPVWFLPLSVDDGVDTDLVNALASGPAGETYVAGTYRGDRTIAGTSLTGAGSAVQAFVARLDPSGVPQWVSSVGGNLGLLVAIATNTAGRVVVAGTSSTEVDYKNTLVPIAGGGYSPFLLQLDGDGNLLDLLAYGATTDVHLGAVGLDAAGGYVLGARIDAGGAIDFGGGALVAGADADAIVAHIASTGAHVFSRIFAGAGDQSIAGVAFGASGEILLAGSTSGAIDFGGGTLTPGGGLDAFVARLDATGAYVDADLFGGPDDDAAAAIVQDPAGGYVVAGSFTGIVGFGGAPLSAGNTPQAFVVAFDPAGAHRWSRAIHASAFPSSSLAIGPFGPVFAGSYSGSFDAGLAVVPTQGGSFTDGFVVRLAP